MDADQSPMNWYPLMRQGWNSPRRSRSIIENRAIITVTGMGEAASLDQLHVNTVKQMQQIQYIFFWDNGLCTGPEMVLAASTIGCTTHSTILSILESNQGVLPSTAHKWGNPHSLLSGGLWQNWHRSHSRMDSTVTASEGIACAVAEVLWPAPARWRHNPSYFSWVDFLFFGVLLIICLVMPITFSVLKNWALYLNLCSGKWKSCNIKAIKLKS